MPGDRGQAQAGHPRPVAPRHRLHVRDADDGDADGARDPGPEEADLRAVLARDQPGEKAVDREHQRRRQRQHGQRAEHPAPRLQDDEDAREPRSHGGPAAPADPLAQDRPRQGDDEQRIGGEKRVRADQPQPDEGDLHDDDLGHQQQPARDLDERPPRPRHGGKPAGRARRHRHDECGEEPVAQHDDEIGRIVRPEMARQRVLDREDEADRAHQDDGAALPVGRGGGHAGRRVCGDRGGWRQRGGRGQRGGDRQRLGLGGRRGGFGRGGSGHEAVMRARWLGSARPRPPVRGKSTPAGGKAAPAAQPCRMVLAKPSNSCALAQMMAPESTADAPGSSASTKPPASFTSRIPAATSHALIRRSQ